MKPPQFNLRRLFVLLTLICLGVAAWVSSQVVHVRERTLGVDGITVWAMDDPPVIVAFQALPHDGRSYYQGDVPVAGWTHYRGSDGVVKSKYRWGELDIVFNDVYHLSLRERGKLLTVCGINYRLSDRRPIVLVVDNDRSVREAEGVEKDALLRKVVHVTRERIYK